MKIRGVLLGTVKEQIEGGDRHPISPGLIKLDRVEDGDVAVTIGFQQDKIVGRTTRVWLEDGRLLFEADVIEDLIPRVADKSAIGFVVDEERPLSAELAYDLEQKNHDGTVVKGGRLFQVGLTDENENRNQPPFEVIDE